MSVLERVKAHFNDRETRIVKVPEWGESEAAPLEIHPAPLTLKLQQRIQAAQAKDGDVGAAVEILICLAKDSDGKSLFSIGNKAELMREADPMTVARVSGQVYEAAQKSDPFTD